VVDGDGGIDPEELTLGVLSDEARVRLLARLLELPATRSQRAGSTA